MSSTERPSVSPESGEIWEHLSAVPRSLVLAALDTFADRGYHASTTREIAERAGLSPAAVYVHFRSKQELLQALSVTGHQVLLSHVREAVDAERAPEGRVSAFVKAFAHWHAEHNLLARVLEYEMKSLEPDAHRLVVGYRDEVDSLLQGALADGRDAGRFEFEDLGGTALAIVGMGIDLSRWYRPGGRLGPADLGAMQARLALRMVSVDPPDRGV